MKCHNYIALLLLIGCNNPGPIPGNALETALDSRDPRISRVVQEAEAYELQILFTRVSYHDEKVVFEDAEFRVDDAMYFYPASTVKLPIAALTLEKLTMQDSLDLESTYFIEGDSAESSFGGDLLKIFAVSDNEASNRLVEFLGFDSIQSKLKSKGLGPVRISQRLGGAPQDPVTRPLIYRINDSTLTHGEILISKPFKHLQMKGLLKGRGFYRDKEYIAEPFDFSLKNYYPLTTQHQLMKRLIFPDHFPPGQRFNLSPRYHDLLLDLLRITPRKAGYDSQIYPDSYGKFFLYGDSNEQIPDGIEIYNKAGWAYGTLTDCSFIRDREQGIEFFLSVSILVNKNEIFNDDQYEYESVGLPFLAALSREIHQYLIKSKNDEHTEF